MLATSVIRFDWSVFSRVMNIVTVSHITKQTITRTGIIVRGRISQQSRWEEFRLIVLYRYTQSCVCVYKCVLHLFEYDIYMLYNNENHF